MQPRTTFVEEWPIRGAATSRPEPAAGAARHWKRATFGWLAFTVVAILLGGWVGAQSMSDEDAASGEAAVAEHILSGAGFRTPATESVLVQSADVRTSDPAFQSAIAGVVQMVSRDPNVVDVRNPLLSPSTQISRDRHSALVQFDISGKRDDAEGKVQPIMDAVAAVQRSNPNFLIEQFGYASSTHVLSKVYNDDFARAEKLSLPLTLLVLLFAFGALVAAGIPVLLAFSAVLAAIGLNELVSHVVPVADATKSVILLVGMAVGVDYSLFYLRREREERAKGAEPEAALGRAAATSGQAVLISGGTVLIAMAGMFLAGNHIFTSIALGTMIVVFVAMIGSLTVLPALLHKLGDRVEKGQIPFFKKLRRPAGQSRAWAAILRPVLRHPAVAVVVAGGALVVATLPVLDMHTKLPSFTDLPAQPRDRPHVPAHPAGVPGLADARRGRREGRRRDDARVSRRLRPFPRARRDDRRAVRAVPRLRQSRPDGGAHRALDRRAPATTGSRTRRCTRCAPS